MAKFKTARLRDCVTKIGSGITPSGGAAVYTNNGVPLIRSQNVKPDQLDLGDVAYIDEHQHLAMRNSQVRPQDVLLNITGASIGRSCVVPSTIKEANVNQHVCIIRATSGLDPYFLCAFLNSNFGQRQIYWLQGGGSRQALNYEQIGRLEIPLPEIGEQKQIAAMLQTWDQAIALTEKLIDRAEVRLDAVTARVYRGTAPRNVTEAQWQGKLTTLGQVFVERRERNPGLSADEVVTVGKYAIRKQSDHFNRSVASQDLSNYWTILPGDFVYDPMSAYYGALGRYKDTGPGIVSPAYRVIRLTPDVDPEFIEGLLKTHYCRFELKAQSSQGNKEGKRRSLQRIAFNGIRFVLPDRVIQSRIAQMRCTFRAELQLLRSELDALKSQKRGILRELLTDQRRATISTTENTQAHES